MGNPVAVKRFGRKCVSRKSIIDFIKEIEIVNQDVIYPTPASNQLTGASVPTGEIVPFKTSIRPVLHTIL